MKQVIFYTNTTTQLLAAALLSSLFGFKPDETVFVAGLNSLVAEQNDKSREKYKGCEVFIVGPLIDTRVLKNSLGLAKNITWLKAGKPDINAKFFSKCHENAFIVDDNSGDNLSNVINLYKKLKPEDKTFVIPPIVTLLLNPKSDKEMVDAVYRTMSVMVRSIEDAVTLLAQPKEFLNVYAYAGLVLNERHVDFVRRALEETHNLYLTKKIEVPCIGTNKQYASCLATELAKLHGLGAAYYDTAEFRHFEIRATDKASRLLLESIVLENDGLINHNSGRFRYFYKTNK